MQVVVVERVTPELDLRQFHGAELALRMKHWLSPLVLDPWTAVLDSSETDDCSPLLSRWTTTTGDFVTFRTSAESSTPRFGAQVVYSLAPAVILSMDIHQCTDQCFGTAQDQQCWGWCSNTGQATFSFLRIKWQRDRVYCSHGRIQFVAGCSIYGSPTGVEIGGARGSRSFKPWPSSGTEWSSRLRTPHFPWWCCSCFATFWSCVPWLQTLVSGAVLISFPALLLRNSCIGMRW